MAGYGQFILNLRFIMSNVTLDDKYIGDVRGKFVVPGYQRGYRWTESQVRTLLDDLWENCNHATKHDYCLQPVVVRRMDEAVYELIDGQQRFTTIFILLKYIRSLLPIVQINYTLDYTTRSSTAQFLDNITADGADDNIDFFHIYQAYCSIERWLADTFGDDANRKATALFGLFGYVCNNVKVIWYEVDDDEDPIALFTRLNIGRIQLTSAELVKALLLRQCGDDEVDRERVERALQWDAIERELHGYDDELWYFLTTHNASLYPTRIELLFDMMAGKSDDEREKYFTFFWFERQIAGRGVKAVWDDIQRCFLQTKEWFADNVLYHKIGYLIASHSSSMQDVFAMAGRAQRKSMFVAGLDAEIARSIDFRLKDGDTYSDLNYIDHYQEINRLLLLFNVQSVINEGAYQRFPFGKFNTHGWSLEHIHAQNSQGLRDRKAQVEWVRMHVASVRAVSDRGQYDELVKEMEQIARNGVIESRNPFDRLFSEVCAALSEDSNADYVHTISNMALLARNDNAALNNSTFDVKRNMIIDMDRHGAFIPYCTKMVFLKYYTPSADSQPHFWGQADRDAYIKAMANVLAPYLEIIDKSF